MSKYIVDIPDGVEWGVVTCRTEDGFYTRDFDSLEELNSNYINKHFSCLQDAEYQKGYRAGKKFSIGESVKNAEYQRGLNDAWEAAKKIVFNVHEGGLSGDSLLRIFGCESIHYAFKNYSAAEVIAKLKAYEEKQKVNNEIKVGDEVKSLNDLGVEIKGFLPWVVTIIDEDDDHCQGIDKEGRVHAIKKERACKTGRHFDIDKILEKMKE